MEASRSGLRMGTVGERCSVFGIVVNLYDLIKNFCVSFFGCCDAGSRSRSFEVTWTFPHARTALPSRAVGGVFSSFFGL